MGNSAYDVSLEYIKLARKYLKEQPEREIIYDEFAYRRLVGNFYKALNEFQKRLKEAVEKEKKG